jgi:hypothetical protein
VCALWAHSFTFKEIDNPRLQRVLGSDDRQAFLLNQLLEEL